MRVIKDLCGIDARKEILYDVVMHTGLPCNIRVTHVMRANGSITMPSSPRLLANIWEFNQIIG